VCLLVWVTSVVVPGGFGRAADVVPHWRVAAEGRGLPSVSGSTVYFLTKRHEVIAVDGASGTVRWRAGTGEPGRETLGSSVVADREVVVAGDYGVHGFDATTGARRWRFEPRDGYGPGLYLGEADGGLVFTGSPAGRLYAIDTRDGSPRWAAQVVNEADTTVFQPSVSGDLVVAGYSTFGTPMTGGVLTVDRLTGRERWRREFPRDRQTDGAGFGGGPVVSGDLVIAANGDGRIYGLDRATGHPRWVRPPVTRKDGRTPDRDWRALAVVRSALIAGSVTGVVTMLDLTDGKEKWQSNHADGGSVGLRITADDRSVYVPHLGGLLVALATRDGRERWRMGGFSDGFSWAPAISGDRAYVAGSRAGLFALPH
jgi:serine/threonine-protein kinase